MVARVIIGKSIAKALSYNEHKVRTGKAELLTSSGFPDDALAMGFSGRLARFSKLFDRNPRIKTNTLHISLNFPPQEHPDPALLERIATDYMDKLGFGDQPFLVYQHNDVTHTHVHIVTTNIRPYGKPINLHNIARDKSEPARKQLEEQYGLIPAQGRTQFLDSLPLSPIPSAAQYGQMDTKAEITRYVGLITRSYVFTTLDEFNAILRQFNLAASRGPEGSVQFQKRGLTYSFVNEEGQKIGRSIKASALMGRPTLDMLEKQMIRNQVKKITATKRTRSVLVAALRQTATADQLLARMDERSIRIEVQQHPRGELTLYLVDHFNRAAYQPADLVLDQAELLKRLTPALPATCGQQLAPRINRSKSRFFKVFTRNMPTSGMAAAAQLFTQLLNSQSATPAIGPDLAPRKKKKKKKGPGL